MMRNKMVDEWVNYCNCTTSILPKSIKSKEMRNKMVDEWVNYCNCTTSILPKSIKSKEMRNKTINLVSNCKRVISRQK